LREKRGQALIAEGLQEFKEQRYAAGVMMMAHGLKLEPRNITARLILAQVYVQSGYLYRGMQLMEDGLPWAGAQKRYLETAFRLAGYLEDDERILKIVETVRADLGNVDSLKRRWLRDVESAAMIRQERYEEVISLWESARNEPSLGLNAARVRAWSGLGRGAEAIAAVEAHPDQYGVFGEPWLLLMELALANDQLETGIQAADRLVQRDHSD